MSSKLNSKKLKAEFDDYLGSIILKNLALILGVGILILIYYIISDWSLRHNLLAVIVRIPPLVFMIVTLVIHLIYPQKFYHLKYVLYIFVYITLQLMMYGKCLVHCNVLFGY